MNHFILIITKNYCYYAMCNPQNHFVFFTCPFHSCAHFSIMYVCMFRFHYTIKWNGIFWTPAGLRYVTIDSINLNRNAEDKQKHVSMTTCRSIIIIILKVFVHYHFRVHLHWIRLIQRLARVKYSVLQRCVIYLLCLNVICLINSSEHTRQPISLLTVYHWNSSWHLRPVDVRCRR